MRVAGNDRTINPELERWYAARAKSHKVEVAGASHAVYISHPKEVAALIEEATKRSTSEVEVRAGREPACDCGSPPIGDGVCHLVLYRQKMSNEKTFLCGRCVR